MSKVPDFKTLDAMVTFWEEHDLSDYWDELEEVTPEEAAPGQPHQVSITLPFAVLLAAVEQLPAEDARQLYERLGEKLGVA
jgi:hypothetical protein